MTGDGPHRRGGAERVLPAIEARRAVGTSTQHRIAEYLASHPDATVDHIAAALELSKTTIKRHRRTLRHDTNPTDNTRTADADADGDDAQ